MIQPTNRYHFLCVVSIVMLILQRLGLVSSFSPMLKVHSVARKPVFRLMDALENNVEQLRESAQKLRQEAQALESKLDRKLNTNQQQQALLQQHQEVRYTSLKDSIWTLSYRFSSDPPTEDEDENASVNVAPISIYSGKITLKFLANGYTQLLTHESSVSTGGSGLVVEKVWGWDEEISNEDNKEYLLFSTTMLLPASDVAMPKQSLRFYWQAHIVGNSQQNGGVSTLLSLKDGTVTVKKNLGRAEGFWGVFNTGGILAQFRYVGNFVAKPARE